MARTSYPADPLGWEFWYWPLAGFLALAVLVVLVLIDARLQRTRYHAIWSVSGASLVCCGLVTHVLRTDPLAVISFLPTLVALSILSVHSRCKVCGAHGRGDVLITPRPCERCGSSRLVRPASSTSATTQARAHELVSVVNGQIALDDELRRQSSGFARRTLDRAASWFERRRRARFVTGLQRVRPNDASVVYATWRERSAREARDTEGAVAIEQRALDHQLAWALISPSDYAAACALVRDRLSPTTAPRRR